VQRVRKKMDRKKTPPLGKRPSCLDVPDQGNHPPASPYAPSSFDVDVDEEEKEEEKEQLMEGINDAAYQNASPSFDGMEFGSTQQQRGSQEVNTNIDVLVLFNNLSVSHQNQAMTMMRNLMEKQADDHVSITE